MRGYFFDWEALDKLAFANYNEPWILVRIPRIERKVHIERFCVCRKFAF